MPAFTNRIRFLFRVFNDFLFPPVCFGCDAEIESGLVCASCRTMLMTNRLLVCPKCGRPVKPGLETCGRCQIPFCLSRVRALGPYAPPYSTLIQALKYSRKTVLVKVLGQALIGLVESDPEMNGADYICPVPLHKARLRERGYNQSYLLASEVAAGIGLKLSEPLVRVRNTKTQTALFDEAARIKNLCGAFKVKPGIELDGKRIILLDDVITTGATMDTAGRQLLKAGASAVLGLVVAAA